MSESTNSKHREELNTLFGHEKTHNLDASKELLKRITLPNTPFTILGNPEKGYFLAIGRTRYTGLFGQELEDEKWIIHAAWEYLDLNQWQVTFDMQFSITKELIELKKEQ